MRQINCRKRRNRRKRGFTLIEVVISLAILSISLVGLLQLLSQSQRRIAQSIERWRVMHVMSQAAEYWMLVDEDTTSIPESIFPYSRYSITATYADAENIPDSLNNKTMQAPLRTLTLELRDGINGKTLDQLKIDRLNYDTTTH